MYRARLLLAILGMLIFTAPAYAQVFADDNAKAFRKTVDTVTVRQFIDPVTFIGQDEAVYRLAGIDAPGLYDPDPPPWIATATAHLNQTYKGKTFLLYLPRTAVNRVNRLGQSLVHAVHKSDKIWIQGNLVQSGQARVFPTDASPELAEALYTLEQGAIARRDGLWAVPENRILTPDTASQATGRVGVITGKIVGVSQQKTMLYVNFGQDWREDLTLGLPTRLRQALAKKNIDPKTWVGKDVTVRGYVEQYYGPYINLITPAQLTFIRTDAPPADPSVKPFGPKQSVAGGLQQLIITPTPTEAESKDAPQP